MMGLGKHHLYAKLDVAGLICYGNIWEFDFKRLFKPPLGELGVTYVPHKYIVGKPVVDCLFAIIELFR